MDDFSSFLDIVTLSSFFPSLIPFLLHWVSFYTFQKLFPFILFKSSIDVSVEDDASNNYFKKITFVLNRNISKSYKFI